MLLLAEDSRHDVALPQLPPGIALTQRSHLPPLPALTYLACAARPRVRPAVLAACEWAVHAVAPRVGVRQRRRRHSAGKQHSCFPLESSVQVHARA